MRAANAAIDKTNLYDIIHVFVDELIELIEFNEQNLKRIRIQVTKLQTNYPFVCREEIAPREFVGVTRSLYRIGIHPVIIKL
jgi:hypothetical protein